MKKHLTKKVFSMIGALGLVMAMSITSFAEEKPSDLTVDIGGITVDIAQLAEDNGVDPYALKQAVEDGIGAEKASPFSNLPSNKPHPVSAEGVISGSNVVASTNSTMVSKANQDSTAYVANSGALTASGKTPSLGMCAMHTNVTTKTGSTSSTKVKLGTQIYMEDDVIVNGNYLSSFYVEDRGAPTNRTTYWIDIYFGLNNTTNYNAAITYGVQTVSYHYYY